MLSVSETVSVAILLIALHVVIDCAYVPNPVCLDTVRQDASCQTKCQGKKMFKNGYADLGGQCRCFNENDVFYFVDIQKRVPRSPNPECQTSAADISCTDKCRAYKGFRGTTWEHGYCYSKDVCHCYNISKDNFFFIKEICNN